MRRIEIPEGFAAFAAVNGNAAVGARFRLSDKTVTRMRRETGVRAPNPKVARASAGKDEPKRKVLPRRAPGKVPTARVPAGGDGSLASRAADFLRPLCPIYRCDVLGTPMADGAFWLRGRAILTDEELIERARARGWDPDAWRRVSPSLPTGQLPGSVRAAGPVPACNQGDENAR